MIEWLIIEPWWTWVYFACVIFMAGFIRGLTGFGFSAIGFFTLSFIFSPLIVVPLLYILESAASIRLLPRVWQDVPRRWLLLITCGAFIGIPFGIWLLNSLSTQDVRQVTGIMVLIACALLLSNNHNPLTKQKLFAHVLQMSGVVIIVGILSGVANGLAAVGGMIVAVYSLSTPLKMVQLRAGLIVYFLLIDLLGLIWLSSQGQVSWSLMALGGIALPIMLFGNHWGFYYFDRISEAHKRLIAISLLALLASIAILG